MVSFTFFRKTWVTSLLLTAPSVRAVRVKDANGVGGLSELVSSATRTAGEYAAGAFNWIAAHLKEGQTAVAEPIPLKNFGDKGTLGDEMNWYKEGTLVLLQKVKDDELLQAARHEWALEFSGGVRDCAALLSGADLDPAACDEPYSGSLVVVVGLETIDFKDDAHYFPIKPQPGVLPFHLIVHGRQQLASKPMPAHSSSLSFAGIPQSVGSGHSMSPESEFNPHYPFEFIPESYFRQGRVEIVNRVNNFGVDSSDEWARETGGRFTDTLVNLVRRKMLASDWTPCSIHGNTKWVFLPTTHFFPMRDEDPETTAKSLQAMVASLRLLCDRFAMLKARLDVFENKKLQVTQQDAIDLLEFLFKRMKLINPDPIE